MQASLLVDCGRTDAKDEEADLTAQIRDLPSVQLRYWCKEEWAGSADHQLLYLDARLPASVLVLVLNLEPRLDYAQQGLTPYRAHRTW